MDIGYNQVLAAYTDGGCLSANPSTIGGTWAYKLVGWQGRTINLESGILLVRTELAYDMPAITNNLTELYAAMMCLEALPAGYNGALYTDSETTRYRLIGKRAEWTGIPEAMHRRVRDAQRRVGTEYTVELLKGHPTKLDISKGHIDGVGVSIHNVECDAACNKRGKEYFRLPKSERETAEIV